jgi:hypothetical protein
MLRCGADRGDRAARITPYAIADRNEIGAGLDKRPHFAEVLGVADTGWIAANDGR